MVVSAGRRTDIPAFYSDWFFRRLGEGCLYVKNPMNPRQVSKILLGQDTVNCFVLRIKDPGSMMERLSVLDWLGYPCYFQFTLTPYGTNVEPGLPHKSELVKTFRELFCKLGSEWVIRGYDPMLLSPSYTREYHFQQFSRLCGSLEGYTHTCAISFLDIYRKVKGWMEQIQPRIMTESHFCRHYYANFSPAQVGTNRRMRNPESPLLCGRLTGEGQIMVREMKSVVRPADDDQMRFGFRDAESTRLAGKPGRIIWLRVSRRKSWWTEALSLPLVQIFHLRPYFPYGSRNGGDGMRLPKHIGIILDGDRRQTKGQRMDKSEGHVHGTSPGMSLYRMCRELGIGKMSFYGFTADNTKWPSVRRQAFTRACVVAVEELVKEDASLPVLGNTKSPTFPQELLPLIVRYDFGKGGIEISFLVNYSWERGLRYEDGAIGPRLKTSEVSGTDLIIRWGGRRRLSGFSPVQSIYSGLYVVDDYWSDFRREHAEDALKWYATQDIIPGG